MTDHMRPVLDDKATMQLLHRTLSGLGISGRVSSVSDAERLLRDRGYDQKQIQRIVRESCRYTAFTVTGRTKRGCTFCAACNYAFQGLASDGAKLALWFLYRAGFPMVNFVHVANVA